MRLNILVGAAITTAIWATSILGIEAKSRYHENRADACQSESVYIRQVNPDKLSYADFTKKSGQLWKEHDQHEESAEKWHKYAETLAFKEPIEKLRQKYREAQK